MSRENILAIPSKDRLKRETVELLADSGIKFETPGRRLTAEAFLPDVGSFTVALIRPRDIVQMVALGELPLGITGSDLVAEYNLGNDRNPTMGRVQTLLQLGIGQCRLVLAAPEKQGFKTDQELRELEKRGGKRKPLRGALEQFNGLTIATNYPLLTTSYLMDTDMMLDSLEWLKFTIVELNGSIEVAPNIGIADAISDLVETGTTLKDNSLKEIETIFESEAVLITNAKNRKGQNRLVDAVRDRLFAVLLQKGNPDAVRKQAEYNEFIASYR